MLEKDKNSKFSYQILQTFVNYVWPQNTWFLLIQNIFKIFVKQNVICLKGTNSSKYTISLCVPLILKFLANNHRFQVHVLSSFIYWAYPSLYNTIFHNIHMRVFTEYAIDLHQKFQIYEKKYFD